jgi:hypothetical protein
MKSVLLLSVAVWSLGAQEIPPLPGAPHVLTLARAPDASLWAGTYGDGVFVLRSGAGSWERFRPDTTPRPGVRTPRLADGSAWYGTVGNGWGRRATARPGN